ncbi:hypothetical protein GEZ89_04030 [Streptococcus mitis]|uniref:Uncharacterized protein n=1 Tax=Streptococcus mitis TaxID=28037 RepID=A0A7X1RKZ5_STRMT|nr:hypothetical protein [Streptococcus mitis]
MGSVTGLTKDGQAVSSSRYHLYGARKTSTDTTGNPFAYNGEARDDTGLDYLRARYYDSQGGTFLTEDSYPGEETDPLSQNRYSYVQNNPVNYTDPSGHFWNSIKKGWNYVKSGLNWAGKQISRGVNWVGRQISRGVNWVGRQIDRGINWVGRQIDRGVNWVSTQFNRASNWLGRQWNKVQTAYNSTVDYVQTKYQQAQARIQELHYQAIRTAYAVAIGFKASPTIREGKNLLRNWNPALLNTLKHICDPKTTKASDRAGNKVNSVDDYSVSAYEFKQNLKKQYGFDEETSDLLWKLYKNIEKTEGGNTDYIYNRLVGGVTYNNSNWSNFKWNNTAGSIGDIRSELDKYGIKDSQAEKLIYNIRIQYYMSSGSYGEASTLSSMNYEAFKLTASKSYPGVDFDTLWNSNYSKYSGKTDFAHQSITTATHLYDKPAPADVYGIFMGGTSALAGWRGDVTKDAEDKPSLGNDDYKADLDTVNITSIMQKNKVDYISASNLYYDGISSGSYTRANAFKENVSLDYVKKAVYNSLVPSKVVDLGPNIQSYSGRRTDAESMEYLKKNYPDSYNFIRSLEEGKNDLQDYID